MSEKHEFPKAELEMSEEEMGRIALAYVRNDLRENLRIRPSLLGEVGEKAKILSVPFERARVFVEILTREAVEEAFSKYKM